MTATPSTISGTLDVLRQPVTTVAPSTLPTDIFNILRGGAAVVGELAGQQQSMDMMREDARRRAEAWAQDAINEDARQQDRDQRQQDRMALEADKVERERLSTLRGTYLDGARPEVIRLVERLNRNDPALLPVVGDTPDARAAWAESFASNVATSLQLPPEDVADARRDIAARVQELLSNKSTNIDQDAEASRHFFIGQELRSESMSPLDFRVAVDDMQANARYASPEDLLGQVVAPALRDIAQSGNVARVKAIVDAMGYAKSPTTQAFAEDIVQVAEVAKARFTSQQQGELRAQYTLGLLNAGDDTGKLTALAETIKMQANTGAITPEFAVQMTDTINASIDRTRRAREKELQELQQQQAREQTVAATATAMLTGDMTLAPDAGSVGLSNNDAKSQAWALIERDVAASQMQAAIQRGEANPAASATLAARDTLVRKASQIGYVPEKWRESVRAAVNQASTAVNANEPITPLNSPSLATGWALYSQAAAVNPMYADQMIGDDKTAAIWRTIRAQMETPGVSLEQAAAIATRRNTAGSVRIAENDKDVVKASGGNRFNATHMARLSNVYAQRGYDAVQSLAMASKQMEDNTIKVNGHSIYMGTKENLYQYIDSSKANDLPAAMSFMLDDLSAFVGKNAVNGDGKPATSKDLSFFVDVDSGIFTLYDTRTGAPVQPRTAADVQYIAFTPEQLARTLPNPYQRREEMRRRDDELRRQSNLATGMMPFAR
jgi:hypothetical protein